ncbi:Signal transduction histidine kinase containing REC and PAS domain [Methanonatronarchaeum thermophilum]|uniref:Signal transduction histidine kinase containing REC and PAS domain n=1 Tax=Methanonatronarchaeum thermophilum TaxID=1927129 RepID=A0A1Y3GAU6_9EURY|nr:PAS domain S-box protein [Methanonatronarchaeum thermophilum]OUJ18387.1 Signal transduction histidine kinase containing REC and PAS domain [Methanonatronarchaeum thermophilum]
MCSKNQIKALLIDDDPNFLELTKQYIDQKNTKIDIDTTHNPIKILDQNLKKYDCFVCDYKMTPINGIELFEKIKHHKKPFILITGEGCEEVAMEALNTGINRYLPKTNKPNEFYSALTKSIKNEVEKHKTEQKIQRQQAKYKSFIEGNQNPLYIIDQELNIHYTNKAKQNQYTKKQLTNTNYRQHHTKKDTQKLKKKTKKAIKTQETQEYKIQINDKWIHKTISPIKTPKQNKKATVIERDITKQKNQKEKLLKYREIIQQIEDPTMVKNKEGKITHTNKALEKLLQKPKKEIINTKLTKHIPQKTAQKIWRYEKRALEWDETVQFTTQITINQKNPYIQITSTPYKNNDKLTGIIIRWRDITKEKTMEIGLREEIKNRFESENKLQTLLNNIPCPVIYLNKNNTITKTNKEFKKLTGQKNLDGKKPPKPIKKLINRPKNKKQKEIKYTDPKGTKHTLLATTSTYSNPKTQNKIDGTIIVYQDITNIRRIEEREKLIHSIMRHDLKNKIQIIKGYLGLIEEQQNTTKTKKYLNKTQKALNESQTIIQKVRTLRKTETNQKIQPLNLQKTIKKSIKIHRQQLKEKNIKIKNQTQEIYAMADPMLEQAISNLIENSIKHADPTEIKIKTQETPNNIKIKYQDNGKGIPDKQKQKVFHKGYSGQNRSTGLGLHLTKKIIEGYNGQIKLKDTPTGGAEFQIKLKKP